MSLVTPPDPRAECPLCGRSGMVGRDREFTGNKAASVYKCHACNHTWQEPDEAPAVSRPKRRSL